nr:molybdopterin-dependent oxidoreductase [Paraburkholderia sp. DHOC27]
MALLVGSAQASSAASSMSLDVMGKIAVTNETNQTNGAASGEHRAVYHFTQAQLLALPAHSITTSTRWTARATFTGPLLSDVLRQAGAHGTQIEVQTLDDYTETIPLADCDRYGVVVAYSMNGKRLEISDFGPLFLIYPRDAFPTELSGPATDAKFVWQIKSLIVK